MPATYNEVVSDGLTTATAYVISDHELRLERRQKGICLLTGERKRSDNHGNTILKKKISAFKNV